MKSFIRVKHNGVVLCGSDFAYPIKGLGRIAINNRLKIFKQRIESLKGIKPHLNTGVIEFVFE